MPPRIRTRASKAMKENVDTENKLKPVKNNTKPFRKALADKTNSASDETSIEVPKKPKRVVNKISTAQPKQKSGVKSDELPRRNRRVPQRFQKDVVTNISTLASPNNTTVDTPKPANKNLNTSSRKETPVKSSELEVSPFKTPSKLETSLVVNRPRRICRLPSRFDDHFVSPNKVIPLQPSNASTPKQPHIIKSTVDKVESIGKKDNQISKPTLSVKTLKKLTKDVPSIATISPDTNNNGSNTRSTRSNKAQPKPPAPKKPSPKANISQILVDSCSPKVLLTTQNSTTSAKVLVTKNNSTPSPKVLVTKKNSNKPSNTKTDKSLSFQVLGGKKKSQESDNKDLDIYEFTFDPTEEPQPQKKKKKKPAIKKPKVPKPKTVTSYKSTYDQNISKALSALKKTVQTTKKLEANKLTQIQEISDDITESNDQNNVVTKTINVDPKENFIASMNDTGKTSVHGGNYPSIRIEDIAADIEPSLDHHTDLNYSPVNSPRPQSPAVNPAVDPKQNPERLHAKDPLNLQEDLSFFDDIPVASSSMNMSVRHPLASPWRVEFGSLPIKWHSNAYVKPNMTPAVESSFICTEDSNKKKHVYTNMVPEANESLPQIVSDAPALKQTSIISFIKEVAERQAKKKRGRSVSPSKAAVEFNNIDIEGNMSTTTAEKVSNNPVSEEVSSNIDSSNDTETSKENRKTRKRKNNENICEVPAKSPYKEKNKDCTYFGFNDSEDQENVSPAKTNINARGRSLRPRTRPVLQEINGPTRAALPVAVKSKIATSSEAVNKVYGEMKSAADAPVFLENVENNVTNIEDLSTDDSQSVHLFEDIDVVHYLKPTRKSYGKARKVTFRQPDGDSEEGMTQQNDQSSFEDDLGDLTFDIPDVKEKKKAKKKRPKKLMSKKEEKEAEEWAAGFNSMCEEIEEFPLMVE